MRIFWLISQLHCMLRLTFEGFSLCTLVVASLMCITLKCALSMMLFIFTSTSPQNIFFSKLSASLRLNMLSQKSATFLASLSASYLYPTRTDWAVMKRLPSCLYFPNLEFFDKWRRGVSSPSNALFHDCSNISPEKWPIYVFLHQNGILNGTSYGFCKDTRHTIVFENFDFHSFCFSTIICCLFNVYV